MEPLQETSCRARVRVMRSWLERGAITRRSRLSVGASPSPTPRCRSARTDIVPGRTLAAASGQRVDRVDRRVQSVHCPPPEARAADRNRRGWLPRMGAWRWLLLPCAEPMAVLSGPVPGCADTGGNDKAVVRFARPQHWGSSGRNVLFRRRTFSSSVAGPERCAGDLPTPEIRGYRSVCCGRSAHRSWHSPQVRPGPSPLATPRRKRKCPSRQNPCPSRMLQSHFVGPAWFSAPVRPLGGLDRCATAFAKSLPGSPGTGENRSATRPSCRPDRVLSRVRVWRRATFLRCPTRRVG